MIWPWAAIIASLFCELPTGLVHVRNNESAAEEQFPAPLVNFADACSCLHWQGVYKTGGVQCGTGRELDFIGGMIALKAFGAAFCTHFYEKLIGNTCMKVNWRSDDSAEWCYVSPMCPGSTKPALSSVVHWKMCKTPADHLLAERTPEQLAQMATLGDIDIGQLIMSAYPLQKGMNWPDVRDFFLNGREPANKIRTMGGASQTLNLQAIKDSMMPTIIDPGTGMPPHTIVVGNRVYQTVFTEWMMLHQKDYATHPGMMEKLVCIKGCSGPSAEGQLSASPSAGRQLSASPSALEQPSASPSAGGQSSAGMPPLPEGLQPMPLPPMPQRKEGMPLGPMFPRARRRRRRLFR